MNTACEAGKKNRLEASISAVTQNKITDDKDGDADNDNDNDMYPEEDMNVYGTG